MSLTTLSVAFFAMINIVLLKLLPERIQCDYIKFYNDYIKFSDLGDMADLSC